MTFKSVSETEVHVAKTGNFDCDSFSHSPRSESREEQFGPLETLKNTHNLNHDGYFGSSLEELYLSMAASLHASQEYFTLKSTLFCGSFVKSFKVVDHTVGHQLHGGQTEKLFKEHQRFSLTSKVFHQNIVSLDLFGKVVSPEMDF